MSDYICIEIQAQIMKRLPVKSLIRFRSVSKPWKSLIESSEFIKDYFLHNSQQQHQQRHHLLIRHYAPIYSVEAKYFSIVDDDNDTFPLHKHSITAPDSIRLIKAPKIVTSQGLFCIYNDIGDDITRERIAVIWNPLINKKVDIELPTLLNWPYETVVGFWVCPKTGDIKLVLITYTCHDVDLDDTIYIPWEVNVFTMSSGVWRSPLCGKRPRTSIQLSKNLVDIDSFLYCYAYDEDDELEWFNMIIAFDMISEEITELCLPDCLAYGFHEEIVLSKLRESLVVFDYTKEAEKDVCNVWMMEHGDPISFTKLFSINRDTSINRVLGFRMTGEFLIRKYDSSDHQEELFVYEPYSKNIKSVDICAKPFTVYASSYAETLLLLDQ